MKIGFFYLILCTPFFLNSPAASLISGNPAEKQSPARNGGAGTGTDLLKTVPESETAIRSAEHFPGSNSPVVVPRQPTALQCGKQAPVAIRTFYGKPGPSSRRHFLFFHSTRFYSPTPPPFPLRV